jgi:hypothetical protein
MRSFYLWRVLTCIRVTNAFRWGWFLVVSVLRKCICARLVSCQGVAQDTWHLLGELHIVYMDRGGQVSLPVVNVTWIDLDSLAFIFHFSNQFWTTSRSVYSFCEAMVGSLSVASIAVLSAKVTVVDSGECKYHYHCSYSYYYYYYRERTIPTERS